MAEEERPRGENSKPRYAPAAGSPRESRHPRERNARSGSARDGERRDSDRKPYPKRDGERKPYERREGDRKPYERREGDRPYVKRDGERKPYVKRDGERKPYERREGDRPYAKREGDRKPYERREGDRPYAKREGDRPYSKRDGDRKPYERRDGDRKPYERRDGDRKPYERRDGDRPYAKRDGDRRSSGYGSDRRSSRPPQDDSRRAERGPEVPEEITGRDLPAPARNELKTLSKENAEEVARHLVMAARLIDDDPALAHEHALAASRRAGRIAVVRETVAITAYANGDFALALRELRTYRRISGRDDQIALMVDSERGVGRPDRALEVGRAVDRSTLPVDVRVELAIAMSGARLDLGETYRALQELDIPELDPDRAFSWSPGLFAARAAVLEEIGRHEEAAQWQRRAEIAEDALGIADADREEIQIEEIEEIPVEIDGEEVADGDAVIDDIDADPAAGPDSEEPVGSDTDRVDPDTTSDGTLEEGE